MLMSFIETSGSTTGRVTAVHSYEDPLDRDLASDEIVHTTRRRLVRLALVAAETASRFARDGVPSDPVAWMLAPRRFLDGRAPLEACLDRDHCLRAVLLHGLGLGTDADPAALDDLLGGDDDVEPFEASFAPGASLEQVDRGASARGEGSSTSIEQEHAQ